MKITQLESFILHVPVTGSEIADSTHRVNFWGVPGVMIHTDANLTGYGYVGTHAHLPTDRLIADCIAYSYAPLLEGEDPFSIEHLWQKLYLHPPIMWVGRSGITTLALSAIDTALWDIKAKALGMPLWQLLGGSDAKSVEAYNTDIGWLNRPLDQIVADARHLVEEKGYRGVKLKVGKPNFREDIQRVEEVRRQLVLQQQIGR